MTKVQVYDGDGIPPELPEWPKTIREAAETFLRSLNKEDYAFLWKQALEDESPKGMSALQVVIQMKRAIRNQFALWPRDGRINQTLLNATGHDHADDASGVIFEEVYKLIERPEDFVDGPPTWWSPDIDYDKINEELEKEFAEEDKA